MILRLFLKGQCNFLVTCDKTYRKFGAGRKGWSDRTICEASLGFLPSNLNENYFGDAADFGACNADLMSAVFDCNLDQRPGKKCSTHRVIDDPFGCCSVNKIGVQTKKSPGVN